MNAEARAGPRSGNLFSPERGLGRRPGVGRFAALLLFALAVGVGTARAQIVFTDVTATAGVGQAGVLTESVAWGDYDGDGDPDLYLTNNGTNALFRNDGGDQFTDVTGTAGVGSALFNVGASFGDLDNDGDLDLYVVTSGGVDRDLLYRNDGPIGAGGEHVFTDVAASAGIDSIASSRPCALLDYDRDGLLDIFVMSMGANILYRNLGGLQFLDVAVAVGVADSFTGVGIAATDVDDDGWIDVFTGNRSSDVNALYRNQSGASFDDIAAAAGIDKTGLGMGVLSFDYDNDLDFDLYWTTWPTAVNALYENQGDATFVDRAVASGTDDPDGWGISVNAGDIDNDGWMDFFVTNGFSETTTPNVLFRNEGDGTFSDVSSVLGSVAFDGRGVAFADYDLDGDVDLLVTSDLDAETRLWRNDTSNANHWLNVRLVGTQSNRSAIGAQVTVVSSLRATVQEVSGGAGRGSQNSLALEFGLGAASDPVEVRVRWPNGAREAIHGVAPDQTLTIVEGATYVPALGPVALWLLAIGIVLVARASYSAMTK